MITLMFIAGLVTGIVLAVKILLLPENRKSITKILSDRDPVVTGLSKDVFIARGVIKF